jgi:dual specificity phosphatase 12
MGWKNVDTIIPGRLYLGKYDAYYPCDVSFPDVPYIFSIHAARSPRSLTERRITHIVSVCDDAIPAEIPESGIVHLRIPVEDVDFADLLVWLPTACQFMEQAIAAGGVVLVHCHQGLTRSATVVAAYRKAT